MDSTRVLITGSGIAAVECLLALRSLAGDRVRIELLAPAAELVHRPWSVVTPFDGVAARRFDLTALGVTHHRDALAAVVPAARQVHTRAGRTLDYDALVVAVGARSEDAVPGAVTFRGPSSAGVVEQAVGRLRRVVFTAPAGAHWLLPMYELALQTAARVRDRDVLIATPEDEPLAALGAPATAAVLAELDRHGVDLVTAAAPAFAVPSALKLEDGRLLPADVVIALPRVVGPAITGLPRDDAGFVPVDDHCRVAGIDDVYAAGDAVAWPIKHGSIAAQQADAAAAAIARRTGAVSVARPFDPVVRAMLVTGGAPVYIRADRGGTVVSSEPLWWPADKVVGRHLSPYLATAG
jgi:sulfide:quinone oxidoreductase